jgi:hypothetical protein
MKPLRAAGDSDGAGLVIAEAFMRSRIRLAASTSSWISASKKSGYASRSDRSCSSSEMSCSVCTAFTTAAISACNSSARVRSSGRMVKLRECLYKRLRFKKVAKFGPCFVVKIDALALTLIQASGKHDLQGIEQGLGIMVCHWSVPCPLPLLVCTLTFGSRIILNRESKNYAFDWAATRSLNRGTGISRNVATNRSQ